jgi:hypothetical protein
MQLESLAFHALTQRNAVDEFRHHEVVSTVMADLMDR